MAAEPAGFALPASANDNDGAAVWIRAIPPAVSNEAAAAKYPNGWKTVKPYLRVVAQPAA